MSTTTSTTDLKGKTLGGFVVGELLGKGGMGAVFHGQDVNLDRPVAIKVLAPHLAEDSEYRDRFVREARVAAKLNHTNIVQIYRAAHEQGVTYMALELVTGCSLHELLQQHPDFPPRRACELIRDAARGLAVAHEHGIVHRDLKPENILVTPKGRPKLADFGLARTDDQRITATGMFLGTPQYASPEQCNGEELGPESDLYSLGVVLYELLAGRPPHEAPTPLALFHKILGEQPKPLSEVQPQLPPSLGAIVERLLAKQPAARYSSADDLIRDLDQVIVSLPEPPAALDPLRNIESTVVPAIRGVHTQSTAPGIETSRGPAIVVPGTPDPGTVELDFSNNVNETDPANQVAAPHAVTVNLDRAPTGKAARVLPLVVGILVLVLAGLIGSRFLPTDAVDPTDGTGSANDPHKPAYHAPLRVAVLPWSNEANVEDYAWLGDALPGFVRNQLQGDAAIKIIPPSQVSKVLRSLKDLPREERGVALLEAVEADLVVSGSFFVVKGGAGAAEVGVNTKIENVRGEELAFPLSTHMFKKAQVLRELKRLAQSLAGKIGDEAGREKIVASARGRQDPGAATLDGLDLRQARRERSGVALKEEEQQAEKAEQEVGKLALLRRAKRKAPMRPAPRAAERSGARKQESSRQKTDLESTAGQGGVPSGRAQFGAQPKRKGGPPAARPSEDPAPSARRRSRGRPASPTKKNQAPKAAPELLSPKPNGQPAPKDAAKDAGKGDKKGKDWGDEGRDEDDRASARKPPVGTKSTEPEDKPVVTYSVDLHPLLKAMAEKKRWEAWELGALLRKCIKCTTVQVHARALELYGQQDAETRELLKALADELAKKN